jgi:hypothetical protein
VFNLGGGGGINPLALLIAPLVGISLLTAAVAVALNPVLVSVSLTGRRKRRSDSDDQVSMILTLFFFVTVGMIFRLI